MAALAYKAGKRTLDKLEGNVNPLHELGNH